MKQPPIHTQILGDLRAQLKDQFVERDEQIDGTLCAILSKQHLFMVGPPGTAKSMLTDEICKRIPKANYFQWLLTKFSTPEEIYGPISLKALENDEYKRITVNKLPEADIAFLDEALDLNTPISTPTGWTTVGRINIGDTIFGAKGKPVIVTNLTDIKENAKCYEVRFENGESLITDGGHNWLCRRAKSVHLSGFKVRTTQEIMSEMEKNSLNWQVPLPDPIELPEIELPIDPYVLGIWLGNGNSWTGQIYIRTKIAEDTLAEIQKTLPQARVIGSHPMSKELKIISLADTGFRTTLGILGLIVDRNEYKGTGKDIPAQYLRGSIEQRLRLVQGLMDTEGYLGNSGTCTFSNTNELVIDGMIELLRSLGVRCAKKPAKDTRSGKKGVHKQCWKVNFRANPDMIPFMFRIHDAIKAPKQRRHLKLTSIKQVPSRQVRCITVDSADHLFLAGNGLIVTHNCFKANSAILNSLLTIVNERKYHNNGTPVKVPLQSLFGASNELPEGEELGALYDRFILRYVVPYIADDSDFKKMMLLDTSGQTPQTVSLADLSEMQENVLEVDIPDDIIDIIIKIRGELKKEGVINSDRRFKQSLDVMKAHAYLNGRNAVGEEDLTILQHILWSQPAEIKTVNRIIIGTANPLMNKIIELMDQAQEVEKNISVVLKDEPNEASAAGVEANAKLKKIGDALQAHKETTINQGQSTVSIDEAINSVQNINKAVLKDCLGLST